MGIREPYPSDASDEEWALVAPCLTLLPEEAGQREHSMREVFNGLRYVVKTAAPWRWMPNDLPPWAAVYQQAQPWLAAGCFDALGRICDRFFVWPRAVKPSPMMPFWTAAPCVPRQRAVNGRATTARSGRRAPSCTWRSTGWVMSWPCTSRPPMPMIALKSGVSRRPCKHRQAAASTSMSIRATPAGRLPKPPRHKASNWTLSSWRRRSVASYCCQDASAACWPYPLGGSDHPSPDG